MSFIDGQNHILPVGDTCAIMHVLLCSQNLASTMRQNVHNIRVQQYFVYNDNY